MKRELIDVLDEKGNITGKVLPLDEVHQKELWHGVAHIWAYNSKGQMLMQQRSSKVTWGANQWDLAGGGHISAAETPSQAVQRELLEELGLTLEVENLIEAGITFAENTNPVYGFKHRACEWNYIAQMSVDLSEVELQEAEAQAVQWISLDLLEEDLSSEETYQNYAPRDKGLYKLVITKIRENLKV